ncbi:hypothetical protein [Actinomadura sp. CNU-125]|uniref:hypothetical protein n=1 Tax=Actinomadura sp. CNU-125 TaxID=1904961 RepID=UPI0011787BA0|nr:hypothetical protein [Actinomadura sp. CNU-125]
MSPSTEEILTALDLTGVEHVNMRWSGVDATIVYTPDRAEFERRQAHGNPSVTRLDWLSLLMNLPHGHPVPFSSFRPAEHRDLDRMPLGTVDITPGGFVRQLTHPLRVELAIVHGHQWKPGLGRASRFAPYCRRALVLAGKPKPAVLQQAAIVADFYSIGLIVNEDRGPQVVVRPDDFTKYRHTPAGWKFLEEVYASAVGVQKAAA